MDFDEGATARRTERHRRVLGNAALGATLVLGAVPILVAARFRSLEVPAYPLPVLRPTTSDGILARPRTVTVEVTAAGPGRTRAASTLLKLQRFTSGRFST